MPHIQSTPKANHVHKERDQPQLLRKKPPQPPNTFAAVGILNSLNPTHLEPIDSREYSDDGFTDSSHRDEREKKEKRSFWDRAGHREKEREREKERDKERPLDRDRERTKEKERERKEEMPAELTRLLGTSHTLRRPATRCRSDASRWQVSCSPLPRKTGP